MIIYEGLLDVIIPALGSVVTAAVSIGIGYAVRYINRKSKNEFLHHAMNTLGEITRNTVAALMQEEVKAMRKASADGKLSDEDKQHLKKTAIETIKLVAADELLVALEKANTDLDTYLETLVESAVYSDKARHSDGD